MILGKCSTADTCPWAAPIAHQVSPTWSFEDTRAYDIIRMRTARAKLSGALEKSDDRFATCRKVVSLKIGDAACRRIGSIAKTCLSTAPGIFERG